jgi:hydroxyacylglutathione hydrolase
VHVVVDRALDDGQVLELSPGLHLRVIAAPGHSPGGVCFLVEEQDILITGDAVPVKGDMPVYDDPVASARSLAKLATLRGLRTIASAWGSAALR